MKTIYGVVIALLVSIGFLAVQPAPSASAANVNNFRISNFDIQYELSRDSEGHSILSTSETITAEFPNFNQNRGLERAIPYEYNGHKTSLKIESVTNGEGQGLEYSTSTVNGMTVLRIGNPERYVRGTQVYKISYTQGDVTRAYSDTGNDEWYWDTNGTEWKVPIDRLSIAARLSDDIAVQQTASPYCYIGLAGSTNRCTLTTEANGYSLVANSLRPGKNVTLAFGFKSGTFAAYQPTLWEKIFPIWIVVTITTAIASCILLIILSSINYRKSNRIDQMHTVPVEYIPPKDASVTFSSYVLPPAGSVFSAQLIDFAVRHYIEIVEVSEKSLWKAAKYKINVITDPANLRYEEKKVLENMFGRLPAVGDSLQLDELARDGQYIRRTMQSQSKAQVLIKGDYGLRAKDPSVSKYFYKWSIWLLVVGVLLLSLPLLGLAGVVALFGVTARPLTETGTKLRLYLLGLKKYIEAAEAERFKFLQGPDTAQKVGESVDTANPGQILKLYERVLPYAILFGQSKEWSKRLGDFYAETQTSPDWYTGQTAFNATVFSTAMSSFSQSASYSSGGSDSSSSGGSSGGGSSGGGGGGGGGGGW